MPVSGRVILKGTSSGEDKFPVEGYSPSAMQPPSQQSSQQPTDPQAVSSQLQHEPSNQNIIAKLHQTWSCITEDLLHQYQRQFVVTVGTKAARHPWTVVVGVVCFSFFVVALGFFTNFQTEFDQRGFLTPRGSLPDRHATWIDDNFEKLRYLWINIHSDGNNVMAASAMTKAAITMDTILKAPHYDQVCQQSFYQDLQRNPTCRIFSVTQFWNHNLTQFQDELPTFLAPAQQDAYVIRKISSLQYPDGTPVFHEAILGVYENITVRSIIVDKDNEMYSDPHRTDANSNNATDPHENNGTGNYSQRLTVPPRTMTADTGGITYIRDGTTIKDDHLNDRRRRRHRKLLGMDDREYDYDNVAELDAIVEAVEHHKRHLQDHNERELRPRGWSYSRSAAELAELNLKVHESWMIVGAQSLIMKIDIPDLGDETDVLEEELLSRLASLRKEWQDTSIQMEYFTLNGYQNEFQRAINEDLPLVFVLVVIMMSFTCLVFYRPNDRVQSRGLLGMYSFATIGCSLLTGYGIMFLAGVPLTSVGIMIPFVVVGVGLDDTFIITGAYFRRLRHKMEQQQETRLERIRQDKDVGTATKEQQPSNKLPPKSVKQKYLPDVEIQYGNPDVAIMKDDSMKDMEPVPIANEPEAMSTANDRYANDTDPDTDDDGDEEQQTDIVAMVGDTLDEVGVSISMTTWTTLLCFLVGSACTIPAVRWLCFYAAACIAVDFIYQISLFIAFLVLDERRVQQSRRDFCFWIIITPDDEEDKEESLKDDGFASPNKHVDNSQPTHTMDSTDDDEGPSSPSGNIIKKSSSESLSSGRPGKREDSGDDCAGGPDDDFEKDRGFEKNFMERFMSWYADQLLKPCFKIVTVVCFLTYFGAMVYSTTLLHQEFNVADYVPKDSFLTSFSDAFRAYTTIDRYIGVYFRHVNQSDENVLRQMEDYVHELANLDQIGEEPPFFWVRDFPQLATQENAQKYFNLDGDIGNSTDVETAISNYINNLTFNEQIDLALDIPELRQVYGSDILRDPDSGDITASRTFLFLRKIDLLEIHNQIDMLMDQRDVTFAQPLNQNEDGSVKHDLAFFTFDDMYFFWELYAIVVDELIFTTISCVIIVTVIAFLFIPHWSSAAFVLPLIIMLYFMLLGTMQYCGIKINSITYFIIVMAIGLLVDFLMHILLHYYESKGKTRHEKVKETLETMGASILCGGFTTFLGVIPLAFSVTKIFMTVFISFLAMVTLGCAVGLIFLPVLLSIIGPEGEHVGRHNRSMRHQQSTSAAPVGSNRLFPSLEGELMP